MVRRKVICVLLVIVWGMLVPGAVWGAAGDLSWEHQITFLPTYDNIFINGVGVSSTSYIISGYAAQTQGTAQMGFIRALDLANGNVKWETTLTLGGTNNGFGAIMINGDIALVLGSYGSGSPTPTSFKRFLRAYNADTGQLLWEVLRDFEVGPPNVTPYNPPLVTAGNRVVGTFTALTTNGYHDTVFVRAYQVRDITMPSMLLLDDQYGQHPHNARANK